MRPNPLSCTHLIVVQNGITGANWMDCTNRLDGAKFL